MPQPLQAEVERPRKENARFSEAQFKTTKYHPTFPDRIGSLEDAQAWVRPFFQLIRAFPLLVAPGDMNGGIGRKGLFELGSACSRFSDVTMTVGVRSNLCQNNITSLMLL